MTEIYVMTHCNNLWSVTLMAFEEVSKYGNKAGNGNVFCKYCKY